MSGAEARLEEASLITRARGGDQAAFGQLVERYQVAVYNLCYRMLGQSQEAEDAAQEVFLKAWKHLPRFRGAAQFSTWLHTIALSVSLNGLRKVKQHRTREAAFDEALTVSASGREAEPDLKARLKQAIDALPEGYRTVFVMHDVEGYTHEEIAASLGIQPGTSKAQLFRARAKLRIALADFAGEWVS